MEFDCAHLDVDQSVFVQDGQFSGPALFTQEFPVLYADDSLYVPIPARVFGCVEGNELILHVKVEDQPFGTFTLRYDVEARIYKCA